MTFDTSKLKPGDRIRVRLDYHDECRGLGDVGEVIEAVVTEVDDDGDVGFEKPISFLAFKDQVLGLAEPNE